MNQFAPGDDLIFQIESGYGLLRVLAVDGDNSDAVWHLLAYDEFFPDVESAEERLALAEPLQLRKAHMALTNRAFERTPVAKLGNRTVTEEELAPVETWRTNQGKVEDRSALLLLGIR